MSPRPDQPGAIINVRRGQYEDASGFLHKGWLHDHVCAVPDCGKLVNCDEQPRSRDDADGMPFAAWGCDFDGHDALCTVHKGALPCDYCGEYGHAEAKCPEAVSTEDGFASWDKTDFEEYAADVAYQLDKDER